MYTKEERKKYWAAYRATHREKIKEYTATHREAQSVRSHYNLIFSVKNKYHENYKGMPFFDAWSPDKGGSFKNAEKWIINNLGKRPEGCTLHIVDHSLGFVPGNLEWTTPTKQTHQQKHKIIAQQQNEIKKLKAYIQELEAQIV